MNDNLKSAIRDVAKWLGGATLLSPFFNKVGIDPSQIPGLAEYGIGALGIAASIWSQIHTAKHVAVPIAIAAKSSDPAVKNVAVAKGKV